MEQEVRRAYIGVLVINYATHESQIVLSFVLVLKNAIERRLAFTRCFKQCCMHSLNPYNYKPHKPHKPLDLLNCRRRLDRYQRWVTSILHAMRSS